MTFTQHPLSAAFPAMSADEFASLKDSILEVGVLNPIVILDGMVLDGWNRYTAANAVGMDCPSVELGDTDPRDFVIAQNKARRHLTGSQRADAVTAVYQWHPAHREKKVAVTATLSKTNAELAGIAGVAERTIRHAKTVHASAVPAVQEAVKTGAVSVETAASVAKLPAKEQKKIAAKGPEAMRAAAKPAPVNEPEDDGPSDDELAANAEAQAADAEAVQKLLEADDQLAFAMSEVTRLNAEVAQLKIARDGYMNKCNEAIKLVKARDRTIAKLEQKLKVEA